jgi:hypothetical protein
MSDPDCIDFEPKTRFTRRAFVMTTLATGFAAAVQPYRKEAADDGWKRALEWFRKNGVA